MPTVPAWHHSTIPLHHTHSPTRDHTLHIMISRKPNSKSIKLCACHPDKPKPIIRIKPNNSKILDSKGVKHFRYVSYRMAIFRYFLLGRRILHIVWNIICKPCSVCRYGLILVKYTYWYLVSPF